MSTPCGAATGRCAARILSSGVIRKSGSSAARGGKAVRRLQRERISTRRRVILAGMHPATPPLPHPLSEAERGAPDVAACAEDMPDDLRAYAEAERGAPDVAACAPLSLGEGMGERAASGPNQTEPVLTGRPLPA